MNKSMGPREMRAYIADLEQRLAAAARTVGEVQEAQGRAKHLLDQRHREIVDLKAKNDELLKRLSAVDRTEIEKFEQQLAASKATAAHWRRVAAATLGALNEAIDVDAPLRVDGPVIDFDIEQFRSIQEVARTEAVREVADNLTRGRFSV